MAAQPEGFYALQPMTMSHLPGVLAIERTSQSHPWSRGLFEDCLRAGYSAWVILNPASEVVAFTILSMGFEEAHILNVAVDSGHRRQGLGARLMRHVLHLGHCAGAHQALLEVRASNAGAVELYGALGFGRIAVRKAYYPAQGGREDAWILACPLPLKA